MANNSLSRDTPETNSSLERFTDEELLGSLLMATGIGVAVVGALVELSSVPEPIGGLVIAGGAGAVVVGALVRVWGRN